MPKHHRILCPVDLSENSFAAIELASMLAKQHDAKIAFFYVSAAWDPSDSSQFHQIAKQMIEDDKTRLYKIRPNDPSIAFEHQFLHGNPGPELVKASCNADMVVMSTHGRSGLARMIMGSVANYVLRNAACRVYLVKNEKVVHREFGDAEAQSGNDETYITECMHQVAPIHSYETMDSVLTMLKKVGETAAPVVDGVGKCVGILTTTDIDKFQSLRVRFNEKDESVIEEMFEVDQFGQRRPNTYNFDQVERHMTKEVVSLADDRSLQDALDLFSQNPQIHHLIVMDETGRPVGIVDLADVDQLSAKKGDSASTDRASTESANS